MFRENPANPPIILAQVGFLRERAHKWASETTKLKISAALGERNTRMALLIVDMICTAMDMIEEQPSAIVEALIERAEKEIREESKSPRLGVRKELRIYLEEQLKEARARERRLYRGITGEDEEF